MIVNFTSTSELNGDDQQTIIDFVTTAMTDCIAKGSTEFVLIFASHGGGKWGFGGDEHKRRRHLAQSNYKITGAIQTTLGQVPGAPTQLDVIGFDACLMQSLDAIDDYRKLTKYYLASEAVEPGHGQWKSRTVFHD